MTDERPGPDPAWSTDDGANEWWPALPGGVSGPSDDDVVTLPQTGPTHHSLGDQAALSGRVSSGQADDQVWV